MFNLRAINSLRFLTKASMLGYLPMYTIQRAGLVSRVKAQAPSGKLALSASRKAVA